MGPSTLERGWAEIGRRFEGPDGEQVGSFWASFFCSFFMRVRERVWNSEGRGLEGEKGAVWEAERRSFKVKRRGGVRYGIYSS